jgi:hypothetical protein
MTIWAVLAAWLFVSLPVGIAVGRHLQHNQRPEVTDQPQPEPADPFEYEPPHARTILADHGLPEDVIDGVLAVHAHELAERLRNVHTTSDGDEWNWWDAATIPASCADLIDPSTLTRSPK